MAQPDQGNSTSANQDQGTGMTPKPSPVQDRGRADEGGSDDQWSKRSGERDGAKARQQSRTDPEVSGTPESGEA